MAAYPSIIQSYGSTQKNQGGFTPSRTIAGTLKLRSYFLNDVVQFEVLHDVNDTDKQTLETFYLANRKLPFDFTWAADQTTYTCRFLEAPRYSPTAGNRWAIRVSMEVI